MSIVIEEFGLENKSKIAEFAEFPWRLYKNEPLYVPQLKGELMGNKLLGIKGLLTPEHPYHKNGKVTHWLAFKNGKVAGRMSGAINETYNKFHNESIANFGFFECENDHEVAKALFDEAEKWARAHKMKTLRGPGFYSNATHEPYQGLLLNGYDDPPCLEMVYHPPYYIDLVEKNGFKKAKDYYAVLIDARQDYTEQNDRVVKIIQRRTKAVTRQLDMKNLKRDVATIVKIYNEAWKNNWGFLPLTEDDGDAMAEVLALVAVPDLIRFAQVNGSDCAVVGFLPDLNEKLALRKSILGNGDIIRILRMVLGRKSIERYRFFFLGVTQEHQHTGLDFLLTHEIKQRLLMTRAKSIEASLLLEENHAVINLAVKRGGGKIYKTYRVYDKPL